MDIYERIDVIAKEKGMSRSALARKTGLSPSTLNSAITRKSGLSVNAFVSIASALGVTMDYLYKDTPTADKVRNVAVSLAGMIMDIQKNKSFFEHLKTATANFSEAALSTLDPVDIFNIWEYITTFCVENNLTVDDFIAVVEALRTFTALEAKED